MSRKVIMKNENKEDGKKNRETNNVGRKGETKQIKLESNGNKHQTAAHTSKESSKKTERNDCVIVRPLQLRIRSPLCSPSIRSMSEMPPTLRENGGKHQRH